jgi:hypothetical protein
MYRAGLPGAEAEFTAYRLLYFLHTRNRSGIFNLLSSLTSTLKMQDVISHSLRVREALSIHNYHQLNELSKDPPLMCGYLMDQFLPREKMRAARTVCKSYHEVELKDFLERVGWTRKEGSEIFNKYCQGCVKRSGAKEIVECKKAVVGLDRAFASLYGRVDIKGQL